MTPIIVTLRSIDRFHLRRSFRTLAGAQAFAHRYVGPTPGISLTFQYAVSDDGVCKITASCSIVDLFPASAECRLQNDAR